MMDVMTAASDNTDRVIRDLVSVIRDYRPDPVLRYRRALLDRIEEMRKNIEKPIRFGELGNRELDL